MAKMHGKLFQVTKTIECHERRDSELNAKVEKLELELSKRKIAVDKLFSSYIDTSVVFKF